MQLDDLVRFYLPLEVMERAEGDDPDSCRVAGACYTQAEVPGDKWVLPYDVLKRMATDYTGAVREMHQPIAAGVAERVEFDDAQQVCRLTTDVVDPVAAKKCRRKVYRFYSLGVKPSKTVQRADGKLVVMDGTWRETSLCDVGMDKGATLSLVRLETTVEPYEVEELERDDKPDEPYGSDANYADPGYRGDKKRYPLDTEAHVRAAWSYWNQSGNQDEYTPEQRAHIESKIKAAAAKVGIEISDDDSERAATDPADLSRADAATSADVPVRENLEGGKPDARRIKKVTHYDCGSADGCCGHLTRGGAYECMAKRGEIDASEVERMMAEDEALERTETAVLASETETPPATPEPPTVEPPVMPAETIARFEGLERRLDELAQANSGLLERAQTAESARSETETKLQSATTELERASATLSERQQEVESLRRLEAQQSRPVLYPEVARLQRSFVANDGIAAEFTLADVRHALEAQKAELSRAPEGETEVARIRRSTAIARVDQQLHQLDSGRPVY